MKLTTTAHKAHEAMTTVYNATSVEGITHKEAAQALSVLDDTVKLLEHALKKLENRVAAHTCRHEGPTHSLCGEMHDSLFRAVLQAERMEKVLHYAAGAYQEALGRVLSPRSPIDQ